MTDLTDLERRAQMARLAGEILHLEDQIAAAFDDGAGAEDIADHRDVQAQLGAELARLVVDDLKPKKSKKTRRGSLGRYPRPVYG